MKRVVLAAIAAMCLLMAVPAFAQTPAPATSTLNFNIGAAAFGLGGATQATPASDVILTLNPGLTQKFLSSLELRSDSVLAPGAGLQFYSGGFQYKVPYALPVSSPLHPLSFYADVELGVDRIVPTAGPSQTHFSFMAGGGVNWTLSNGVTVNLIEINDLHAPGSPWGNDAPAIAGGVSYVFGKH